MARTGSHTAERATQSVPLQQPLHVAGSHTQTPPWHFCPLPHGPPIPHVHAPPWQLSASTGSHAAATGWHWLFTQHPLAQLVESQMHWLPSQRWPSGHSGLLPHLHAPSTHWSARPSAHARHWPPTGPHDPSPICRQLFPEQHPVVHVVAQPVHTPLSQVPVLHVSHAAPAVPQAAAVSSVRQVSSGMQQPKGQKEGVHRHSPPMHCWPGPHGFPSPQRHSPPVQRSVLELGQAAHSPRAPQKEKTGATHSSPTQQPSAQLAGVHTQSLSTHSRPGPHEGPPPQPHTPAVHVSPGSHTPPSPQPHFPSPRQTPPGPQSLHTPPSAPQCEPVCA